MTKEINQAIKKAIQDNLPATVAGELAAFIEEATKLKEQLTVVTHSKGRYEDLYNNKCSDCQKLTDELAKHQSLAVREKLVADRENKFLLEVAQVKLTEADRRADIVQNLVSSLFRNTNYRSNVFTSDMTVSDYDSPAGRTIHRKTGETTTKDTEAT